MIVDNCGQLSAIRLRTDCQELSAIVGNWRILPIVPDWWQLLTIADKRSPTNCGQLSTIFHNCQQLWYLCGICQQLIQNVIYCWLDPKKFEFCLRKPFIIFRCFSTSWVQICSQISEILGMSATTIVFPFCWLCLSMTIYLNKCFLR